MREAEDVEEDVGEDSTYLGSGDEGEYLAGVSDDGKVVVIKLDDGEPKMPCSTLRTTAQARHGHGIRWGRRLLHLRCLYK